MSETKFTPGPWEYDKSDSTVMSKLYIVAYVEGETPEEKESNGNLISAATDLYEALEGLLELAGHCCWDGDGKYPKELNKANAALTKARGEK